MVVHRYFHRHGNKFHQTRDRLTDEYMDRSAYFIKSYSSSMMETIVPNDSLNAKIILGLGFYSFCYHVKYTCWNYKSFTRNIRYNFLQKIIQIKTPLWHEKRKNHRLALGTSRTRPTTGDSISYISQHIVVFLTIPVARVHAVYSVTFSITYCRCYFFPKPL